MFKSITVFTTIIVFIYLSLGMLTGIILEKTMTSIDLSEYRAKEVERKAAQAVRGKISVQP